MVLTLCVIVLKIEMQSWHIRFEWITIILYDYPHKDLLLNLGVLLFF